MTAISPIAHHQPSKEADDGPSSSAPHKVPQTFLDSVSAICKDANQVMVYGWDHCRYMDVVLLLCEAIAEPSWPIRKIFNFEVGDPFSTEKTVHYSTTTEGRKMNHIDYLVSKKSRKILARKCKTALTNLVLENYKRKKEGLPLIPVIFCIDVVDNEKRCTMVKLASKDDTFNNQITYKELRRAFKLCTHENPAIRQVAQETFKFVKTGTTGLELLKEPWADADKADRFWKSRKKQSNSASKPPEVNWNTQLKNLIAAYDAERTAAKPPSLSLASANLEVTKEQSNEPNVIRLGTSQEDD